MLPESEPDPAWDYAQVWQKLRESRDGFKELLVYIAGQESSSPEADKVIKEKIDAIGQQLNTIRRLMDE